jgi:EAL domain-containing protein (putative c-di-GMP-specific phosphodiesterase class I)
MPWLVGAVPVLLGLLITYWQAERALVDDGELTASETVEQVDRILDNVAGAADELLPLAGTPCAGAQLALRDQVARRPYVRSTIVAEQGRLYCGSLFGDFSEHLNAADYTDGRLSLINGNSVTPGRAVLLYRAHRDDPQHPDQSAIAALDGTHLVNTLNTLGRNNDLILQVGPDWLSADGQVQDQPIPTFDMAPVTVQSARYPFSVHTGFAAGSAWRLMASRYPALLGLLLFLGVMAGLICRWLLVRAHSPLAELRRALLAREFVPFFQPVVHSTNKQWAGAEILMRWQHPREGLVRPDLFIPLAEDCGEIVPMTRSLMRQTAALLGPQAHRLSEQFHLAFNISAAHCQDLALLHDCREFLAAFPAGRIKLVLELTERELIEPSEATQRLFAELHAIGVMIALDDFGTGHSSHSYLQAFKIDCLKIDQRFVAMIGVEALSRHILDNVIDLCRKLELQIVAEGVETPEQSEYLAAQNVDYLQGYLFAKPMPGVDFVAQLLAGPPQR